MLSRGPRPCDHRWRPAPRPGRAAPNRHQPELGGTVGGNEARSAAPADHRSARAMARNGRGRLGGTRSGTSERDGPASSARAPESPRHMAAIPRVSSGAPRRRRAPSPDRPVRRRCRSSSARSRSPCRLRRTTGRHGARRRPPGVAAGLGDQAADDVQYLGRPAERGHRPGPPGRTDAPTTLVRRRRCGGDGVGELPAEGRAEPHSLRTNAASDGSVVEASSFSWAAAIDGSKPDR